jgi:hypothetical protein
MTGGELNTVILPYAKHNSLWAWVLLFMLVGCRSTTPSNLLQTDVPHSSSLANSATLITTLQNIPFPFVVPDPTRLHTRDTIYVNPSHDFASDSGDGSATSPFRTISAGVKQATAGSLVLVHPGTYPERVHIKQGGTAESYLMVQALDSVVMHGFRIHANYVGVKGFKILEPKPDSLHGWLGHGIWISAHHVYVGYNHIFGLHSAAGIQASWGADKFWEHIHVEYNTIEQCNAGITISGNNWLVEGNRIRRLIRSPHKGGDADYMRFFGRHIVIRGNYMHDTREEEIGQSHTDLFQTFHQSNNHAHHVLIEYNTGHDFYHQGIMAEGILLDSMPTHSHFYVRHNIFADATSWGICAHGIREFIIENNLFINNGYHSIGFRPSKAGASSVANPSTGVIKNNIFSHAPNYWWDDSEINAAHNLIFPAPKSLKSPTDVTFDPLFTNPNNPMGADALPFTKDDGLHPKPHSPAFTHPITGHYYGPYAPL